MKWTKEEEQILIKKKNWKIKELSQLLNRSYESVKNKRKELGLSKKQSNLFYTNSDNQYIIDNYSSLPIKEIAKHLNRTTNAIHLQAQKLNIQAYQEPCVGDQFNYLTLIKIDIKFDGYQKRYGYFNCKCGSTYYGLLTHVKNNKVKSCGCLQKTAASQIISKLNKSKTHQKKCLSGKIAKYGTTYTGGSYSKECNELRLWLKDCGYEFQPNCNILDGKEIDLYNDKLKLGIEYCGLYWHNELSPQPRDKYYHYNKYKKCLDQDIQLITIFSDEWLYRKDQVKGYLESKLINKKIGARKCVCKIIHSTIGSKFIDQYHIQGKKSSKYYFGLYYKDDLVGVISYSLHHRNSKDLVLDRMCFKRGTSIIGGAAKLVSFSLDYIQQPIISWSDNRWSLGQVYKNCGFVLDSDLPSDYSYVKISNPKKRISKQSMTKSKIKCPQSLTEKEYCEQLGYARIWDCGKKRWILKR